MAELYGAVRDWDMIAGAVVRQSRSAPSAPGLKPVAAAAVAATLVLLLTTGFRVGVSSNIYHLPLVSDYASMPQLAQARFYQDLRWMLSFIWPLNSDVWPLNSGVWPLSPAVATEANVPVLYLGCTVAAAFGGCFAMLRIATRLAAVDAAGLAAGALLIGVTYLDSSNAFLSGATIVGGYFTTTQLATVLVALSLALALDGSLGVAIALLGVAFGANPAVALWGVAGLLGASVAQAHDGMPIGRVWLNGGACALALAAPAVVWWARHFAGHGSFSGGTIGDLGLIAPDQLLVWTIPLESWVLFGSTVVLGLSAFSVLGSGARAACGAFLGFLAVFVVGCALPFVTDNQWLLSLRPMAADTFLQLLAAGAAIAVVLRDLRGGGGVLRVALSVAIAVCLLLHWLLLPLAALAMVTRAAAAHGEMLGLERRIRDCDQTMLCRLALGVVVLAGLAGGVLRFSLPPQ